MPTLALTGSPHQANELLAYMRFPNDGLARHSYMFVSAVGRALINKADDEVIEMTAKELRQLLDAPSLEERIASDVSATKRAICAGDVLSCIYLMHKFESQISAFRHPSLNKAIAVLEKFGRVARFGDGDSPSFSDPSIRLYWEEFKPVAHFWAAFRINQSYSYLIEGKSFTDPENLQTFLSMAAELQRFGTTFCPSYTKVPVPILDAKDIWMLPSSIEPLLLDFDRPPDLLQSYLKTYTASKSK